MPIASACCVARRGLIFFAASRNADTGANFYFAFAFDHFCDTFYITAAALVEIAVLMSENAGNFPETHENSELPFYIKDHSYVEKKPWRIIAQLQRALHCAYIHSFCEFIDARPLFFFKFFLPE